MPLRYLRQGAARKVNDSIGRWRVKNRFMMLSCKLGILWPRSPPLRDTRRLGYHTFDGSQDDNESLVHISKICTTVCSSARIGPSEVAISVITYASSIDSESSSLSVSTSSMASARADPSPSAGSCGEMLMMALPCTCFTALFQSSQSSSSLIRNPISMLGSRSSTGRYRKRRVWQLSMSSTE